MKAKIPLLIALTTILPFLHSAPDPVVAADFDKALIMEDSIQNDVSHADVIERIEKLEKKVYFLDQQVVSISKQLFDSYGLYIIRPGDTLGKIAMNTDVKVKDLLSMNEGLDPRALQAGQVIRIRDEKEE